MLDEQRWRPVDGDRSIKGSRDLLPRVIGMDEALNGHAHGRRHSDRDRA
jgi:hypothetical protein